MKRYTFATVALLTAIALNCGSCFPTGGSTFLASTTSAANNHIMLVDDNPATFGFRRIKAFSDRYPDLAVFISGKGMPQFLAETSRGDNRYLILYYPETRTAFACRTGAGYSREIEFSGPYPITESELSTLSSLRIPARSQNDPSE